MGTSHGTTTEQILRACREEPGTSVRGEPEAPATTTQRLAADIRPSIMPLGGQLLSVELRAIGQGYSDCERGSPDLCETTATSSTLTNPSRRGAAIWAPWHLRSHTGTYGVLVFDPHSDETVSLNADRRFVAASLSKLYALLTLYRAVSEGEMSLDDEITMRYSDVWGLRHRRALQVP